jgi:hypothetical protein
MEAYLSEIEGAAVRDEFFKLFLTGKEMGTTLDITFSRRDPVTDLSSNIDYTDVQLTLADRQADVSGQGGGAIITVTQGKLSREIPFDPLAGDRFVVDGIWATVVVVYPEMNRVVRADIKFDNPYPVT